MTISQIAVQEREEFQIILQEHSRRYPQMVAQDYGKLAYQSEFGPEHLLNHTEELQTKLLEEWQLPMLPDTFKEPEAIGHGLCRFHLTKAFRPEQAAPVLAALFCRTAQEHSGTAEGLAGRLALLEERDIADIKGWLKAYRQKGYPPLHHSQAFRAVYAPHYRLLSSAYAWYFPVILKLWPLAQSGQKAIVAIDGRCGSGKSTLANLLAKIFGCTVFHMDDFYQPISERAVNWRTTAGGNMDFERLWREVLQPTLQGEPVWYQPFDCGSGQKKQAVQIKPQPLVIVEGTYSQHPFLADRYTEKIFLTCSPQAQASRLKQREGDYYQAFVEQWIPYEEAYFAHFAIESVSSLVVDTTNFLL